MGTWVALLRGINVGGRNRLAMKRFAGLLEEAGCTGVRTYIQSGNAVFRHDGRKAAAIAAKIEEKIEQECGFRPSTLVMDAGKLADAVRRNPYPQAEQAPKSLHLYFLAEAPKHADVKALEDLRADGEGFTLKDDIFYLYAPDGIGRSKLAAGVEKRLGVAATARNFKTVLNLLELARA